MAIKIAVPLFYLVIYLGLGLLHYLCNTFLYCLKVTSLVVFEIVQCTRKCDNGYLTSEKLKCTTNNYYVNILKTKTKLLRTNNASFKPEWTEEFDVFAVQFTFR